MTQNLDISQNLEKGIYYIEIATEQEKTVKKLVKI